MDQKSQQSRNTGNKEHRFVRRAGVVLAACALFAVVAASVAFATGKLSAHHGTKALIYPNPSSVTNKCGHKQHIAFGGFATDTVPSGISSYSWNVSSLPGGKNVDRWVTTGYNGTVAAEGRLDGYGYCFKGKKPKIVKATKIAPAHDHATASAGSKPTVVVAHCPKGKTLIGGGFAGRYATGISPVFIINSLERQPKSQNWQVGIVNDRDSPLTITAVAVCGTGKTPKMVQDSVNVKEGESRSATAVCPKGKKVAFGGLTAEWHDLEGIAAIPMKFWRPSTRTIRASAIHNFVGPTTHDEAELKAIAYCS